MVGCRRGTDVKQITADDEQRLHTTHANLWWRPSSVCFCVIIRLHSPLGQPQYTNKKRKLLVDLS